MKTLIKRIINIGNSSLVKPVIRQRFLILDYIVTKLHDYLVNYYKKSIYNQLKDLNHIERKKFLNEIDKDINNYSALGFAKFEIISKVNRELKDSKK